MQSYLLDDQGRRFSIDIHDSFTVCEVDEENEPDWFRIHPQIHRLPGGRLVLSVSRDIDTQDEEMLMYRSDDGGHSWHEFTNWPTATERGRHLGLSCAAFENGEVVAVSATLLLTAEGSGKYLLPTWRSVDGGKTWSDLEAADVHMQLGEAVDIYNPDDEQKEKLRYHRKSQAPPAVQAICDRLGHRRLMGTRTLFSLGGSRLLCFAYFAPKLGEPQSVQCLISEDSGRNWRYLSTPGPFHERYRSENHLAHKVDGLCEPSCTRLPNGDLLLVMRLGSRHPLYAARSCDEGHTWTESRPLPVYGILPTVETLPGGVLALCSGRPDVTLSLSFDDGYRWPWTYRFLEDGKPEDPSTRNNAMLQVEPGRLLFIYDYGGYHPELSPNFKGPRRIIGHFIDVQTSPV